MGLHRCCLSKSTKKRGSRTLCSQGHVLNWIRELIRAKNNPEEGRGVIFSLDQFPHQVQPQKQVFWHKRRQNEKRGGRTCLSLHCHGETCLSNSGPRREPGQAFTRAGHPGQSPDGLSKLPGSLCSGNRAARCVLVPRRGVSEPTSQLSSLRPQPDAAPTAQLASGSSLTTPTPHLGTVGMEPWHLFFACSCPSEHPSPPQSQRVTTYLSSGRETDPTSAGPLLGLLLSPSGCCIRPLPSAPRQLFLSRTSVCPLAHGEGKRS